MPGEKQNSWQEKLDALQSVPIGFLFEKEKQWTSLEARLAQPRKKRYGLAAACILLLLTAYLLYPSTKKIPASTISLQAPVVTPSVDHATNEVAEANKKDITQSTIFKSKNKIQKAVIANRVDPTKSPDTIQQLSVVAVLTKDTLSVATTVKAVSKRRFPIAHINELNSTTAMSLEQPQTKDRNTVVVQSRRYATQTFINAEERDLPHRRNKTLFSLISSSQ
jgi:hypothetical protein